MQLSFRSLVLASLAVAGAGWATAARGDNPDPKAESAAIRKAANEYSAAMRRGDFNALCNMWTSEGDYVDAAGRMFKANEIVPRQTVGKASGSEKSDDLVSESTIRIVAPGVAIEDGATGKEVADDGSIATGRFTAVWVKRNGRWRLDSLREASGVPAATSDRLHALDWLIGEWAGKTDNGALLVSSRWSDDGHFIIRDFVERAGDGEAVTATQRIGWDATTGSIKCWTFDSQGGSGEGSWRQDGKRWIVKTTENMPDGGKVTASTIYIPGDQGRFVWEAEGTKVAGENVSPRRVEFKRAAEK